MLVTLSGMTILDKKLQYANAPSPISVTLLGMTILDKELQYSYLMLVDYQYYTL